MMLTVVGLIMVGLFGRELLTSETCKGIIELLR